MIPDLSPRESHYCAEIQPQLLDLIKTLAAIPAPSNQEEKRAAFVKQWLEAQGAQGVHIDGAGNVVLPMGCQDRKDLRMYIAHLDVVFPDTGPLPVREDATRLYAPGVGDDTANVCVLLQVIAHLLKTGATPKEPVLFAFNTGEEGLGNLRGVRQLMQDYAGRVHSVVSLDGSLQGIYNGAVGSERWRVTLRTEGGHSYGGFGNRNAIHQLARLIHTLYGQALPQGGKTTYNVGEITGGTSVNTIAQEASMLYEYRADQQENLNHMAQSFRAILQSYQAEGLDIQLDFLGQRPGMGPVDPQAQEALVRAAQDLLLRETNAAPTLRSGSTDCNLPFSLGIPAVAFGAYRGQGAHTRGEFIEKDSLLPGMRVAMGLVGRHFVSV